MSAILNQTEFQIEPMTREEQNLDPFHSEALRENLFSPILGETFLKIRNFHLR